MLLTLRTTNTHGNARSTADAVITALSPDAWYRNATDVVSSGGFASIWADYASTAKGLVLPGVASNRASTPSSAALAIVGDIDLIAKVVATDWTPASSSMLIDRMDAGSLSYRLYLDTTGKLIFQYTADGATARTATSSVATGVTDGATKWVRGTYVSATGKVNFYLSDDGSTWSALGTEQTITAGAIHAGTSLLHIGGAAATFPFAGIIYRAIVKSGIDGTTVFDADFSSQAIGAGSFTESSSNAATVTINASGAAPAHIGKARDLLQGTGTNQPAYAAGIMTGDGADNFLRTAAFTLDQPSTVVAIFRQDSWTLDDSVWDGATALNRRRLYTPGSTPNMTMYAGAVGPANTGATIGTWRVVKAFYNGASSTLNVDNGADSTGNAGTNTASGFTLFADGQATPVSYGAKSVAEVILLSGELSAGDWASLYDALDGIRNTL